MEVLIPNIFMIYIYEFIFSSVGSDSLPFFVLQKMVWSGDQNFYFWLDGGFDGVVL